MKENLTLLVGCVYYDDHYKQRDIGLALLDSCIHCKNFVGIAPLDEEIYVCKKHDIQVYPNMICKDFQSSIDGHPRGEDK